MRHFIAIDGACRRNGKPDCVSSSGVFIQTLDSYGCTIRCEAIAEHEFQSTNQRGELRALRIALEYISKTGVDAGILTDSEYLFNAMTKEWYTNWAHNSWLTRDGTTVKNKDIWERIIGNKAKCDEAGIELTFYHIKGHCVPFGKVTATNILEQDSTGAQLLKQVTDKYRVVLPSKAIAIANAQELSIKNNGFKLSPEILELFVVSNTVVDAIATKEVDAADLQS